MNYGNYFRGPSKGAVLRRWDYQIINDNLSQEKGLAKSEGYGHRLGNEPETIRSTNCPLES